MAAVGAIADTTASTNNEEQLVTMVVDKQLFGIPILQVQDIVEASKVTAVPLSPSAIGGMLNLRGRIVTVIDLRKLLGNDEEIAADSQMGVTVEHKGDLYTLLVDSIGDVRSVRRADFDKAPTTLEPETRRLCSGIYRLHGSLLVVLDVSRILTSEVIASTTVLTVAERKARKAAALEAAKGEESGVRQLSSQLAGLGSYDAESEHADDDQSSDNIKRRKKESRSRRPIADRWREVMAERARQSGQTVYRVREPDEETLESAQEQMAAEEAAWKIDAKDDRGPAAGEPDDILRDFDAATDEVSTEERMPMEPVLDELVSDEPASDEPATEALTVADYGEPPALDSADETVDQPEVEPAPAAEEPAADVGSMKLDEPAPDSATDPADVVPEPVDLSELPAGDEVKSEKPGKLSGFWKKLRSTDKPAPDEPPAFDEIPASDEVPVADDMASAGDEPIADDEPVAAERPKKARKKAKPAAKKKAPAKRKSSKSSKKS